MAKLRNYEIDALHNVVCKRVSDLKEAKIAEIKKTVVLDEADEMLNMGFREDLDVILEDVKQEHQTVLFSATMPSAAFCAAWAKADGR